MSDPSDNILSADKHRDTARDLLSRAEAILGRGDSDEWKSQRAIALSTMALTHVTLAGQLDRNEQVDRTTVNSVSVVQGTVTPADSEDNFDIGSPVLTGEPVASDDNDNDDSGSPVTEHATETVSAPVYDQDWTVGVRVVHPSNHLPVSPNLVHDALDDLGINFETGNRAVTAEITIVAPDRKTAASEAVRVLNSAFPHDTVLIEDIVSDI